MARILRRGIGDSQLVVCGGVIRSTLHRLLENVNGVGRFALPNQNLASQDLRIGIGRRVLQEIVDDLRCLVDFIFLQQQFRKHARNDWIFGMFGVQRVEFCGGLIEFALPEIKLSQHAVGVGIVFQPGLRIL